MGLLILGVDTVSIAFCFIRTLSMVGKGLTWSCDPPCDKGFEMYIIQPLRPLQDSHICYASQIIALTLKLALYSVKRHGSTDRCASKNRT